MSKATLFILIAALLWGATVVVFNLPFIVSVLGGFGLGMLIGHWAANRWD